jgi:hypothetical protein
MPAPEVKHRRPHNIQVRVVVRPGVDVDLIADALLWLMQTTPMAEESHDVPSECSHGLTRP